MLVRISTSKISVQEGNQLEKASETLTAGVTENHFSRKFTPKFRVEDLDISDTIVKIHSSPQLPESTICEFAPLDNEEARINVGRWAEEFVYKYLNLQKDITSIEWQNKKGESHKPFDFIVERNGEKIYIEVKGTPSFGKNEFYLSVNEWVFMLEQKDNYEIYRVCGVGEEQPKIEFIKSVHTKALNGEILKNPIVMVS